MGAKSRADTLPEIRGGLKRCLKIMEDRGKPISTVWLNLFEEDPATALRLAISTQPKDQNINLTTDDAMTLNTNQLADDVYQEVIRREREQRTISEIH